MASTSSNPAPSTAAFHPSPPSLSSQTNKLINMIERFEQERTKEEVLQDQDEVFNKLHIEVLQFRDAVKDILAEM